MTDMTNEIPDTVNIEPIVSAAVPFIRSLTEAYGSEKGMELWESISSTLGQDAKGKIFFAMLVGYAGDEVWISHVSNNTPKITAIKIIRQYSGLGLFDAKNTFEQVADHYKTVKIKVDQKMRIDFICELRRLGITVS